MDRLGVGFVGAGFVANFHLRSWTGVRHADVKGICSNHMESARKAAGLSRDLGVGDPEAYTDVREMVNNEEIDAVWMATPNFARLPVLNEIVEEVRQGGAEIVGVACEKPLARNVKEGKEMMKLIEEADLLHGYLENQRFAPSIIKGKKILWERGAKTTGRPYLARCSEEHSGPHKTWFWNGAKQGGGAVNDMGCHSHEAARFLLTAPEEEKSDLKPKAVSGEISTLKWMRPDYVEQLEEVDFESSPVEDFGRSSVTYELSSGEVAMAEVSNSWSFMGPGLRLRFELLGPEYSLKINSLDSELSVFFSRRVRGEEGEDLVEKQEAEHGQMPVIPDESILYGYRGENKHITECFLDGEMPEENWEDGLFVIKLLMSIYMAAEENKKLKFPPRGLEEFVPKVARGTWDPKSVTGGHSA